jgi:fido (protein-threonine AMPylation protein)
LNNIPEIIFSSSDKKESRAISKLAKENKLKKIAPRIYTSNFIDSESTVLRRNLFLILGKIFPKSVLSFRSAFEFAPTEDGSIFLTYKYSKIVPLLDLKIRLIKGPGHIEGDNESFTDLYVSQKARAFLENLSSEKSTIYTKRNLDIKEIENKLEKILVIKGEEEINKLRDEAKKISEILNYKKEYDRLNKIIGALLGTHKPNILKSPIAMARAFGRPYDSRRLEMFEKLFLYLNKAEYPVLAEKNVSKESFNNFAFFESYFSNYIEGTILEINDAKKIVKTKIPLPSKEDDSHDVLGTYSVVSEKENIKNTPNNFDELINLLKLRHRTILFSRENKSPGEFKTVNNRAGSTEFVDYTLVMGTLEKGFNFYKLLSDPFSKAIFIHFVISEIHPFMDGNGRMARIMMNSELVRTNQSKILIPNVYRDDYLLNIKQATKSLDFENYAMMFGFAHKFSSNVFGDDIDKVEQYLKDCNAFNEPDESKLKIIEK